MTIGLMSIVLLGLQQVLSTTLTSFGVARDRQDILYRASFALDRMARFVRETDRIEIPKPGNRTAELKVRERVFDTYDNESHAFKPDGDGYQDADNDWDMMVNEDDTDDPYDYVTFTWEEDRLLEELPDYGTAALDDTTGAKTICDHVSGFQVFAANVTNSTSSTLVEIRLDLETGEHDLTLKTRVRPRFVE